MNLPFNRKHKRCVGKNRKEKKAQKDNYKIILLIKLIISLKTGFWDIYSINLHKIL